MKPTSSPWLTQLHLERAAFRIAKDVSTDVAIVGAGIAGIATAYMLLKETRAKVILVDAGRVAHGATGHNAGQVVSYFERPFAAMVRQHGLAASAHAVDAVESAWDMLFDMREQAALRTPLALCTGHAGLSTLPQILDHLEDNRLRAEAGLKSEPLLMRVDPALRREIPDMYAPFLAELPHSDILRMLRTEDTTYIAALSSRKGCMNSAQFCEELLGHLLSAFGDRIMVAEHTPVHTITLNAAGATLQTATVQVHAAQVVLCTNGFEMITINNHSGPPIDAQFHSLVQGLIGYMAGYEEARESRPSAISYFPQKTDHAGAYYYVTHRPFYKPRGGETNLVCLGGPERLLPDRARYDRESLFPADVEEEMDRVMRSLRVSDTPAPERRFLWHGLMGYTPSGLRCIGRSQENARLLFNLGCNGVGILPSIMGAKRIAQILGGAHLAPSLFDPQTSQMAQD